MKSDHAYRQTGPTHRQSGFAAPLILSLVLIVALAAGGFLVWQRNQTVPAQSSPTPIIPSTVSSTSAFHASPDVKVTTESQTYTNQNFNFRLEYPKSLVLDTTHENSYPGQSFVYLFTKTKYEEERSLKGQGRSNSPVGMVEIAAFGNIKENSSLDWAKNNTAHSNFGDKTGEQKSFKIDTHEAIRYTTHSAEFGTLTDTIIIFDDKQKSIIALYAVQSSGLTSSLDQILSTFKFLD